MNIEVCRTIQEIRASVRLAREAGKRIGCVPTMGALHAGHLSLIDECRRQSDFVVVTIFVNPTQFGPNEDLEKYPRTFEEDRVLCEQHSADAIFFPEKSEIYRPQADTFVDMERLTKPLEGIIRPGHFRGVTTIVAKLFNIVLPDVACFGQKDFQQQLVIRRMVEDLNMPVEIVVCPTIREPDGLAMSSRNRYLTTEERRQSLSLYESLKLAEQRLMSESTKIGPFTIEKIQQDMIKRLNAEGLAVDYAVIRDPMTLQPVAKWQCEMVALVAARLGITRLIDNLVIQLDKNN